MVEKFKLWLSAVYNQKDRFKIFSLNDIDKIINKTLNLIYKYGLNYIEKYSNIKSIDNLYNENLIYKLLILNKYKKDSSN